MEPRHYGGVFGIQPQRNGAEAPFLPVTIFSFLRPTYLPGSFSGSPYSTPQVSTRTVSMTWSL